MIKFVDTKIVFQEVPDEVSLAINITGCKITAKAVIVLTWQRMLEKS